MERANGFARESESHSNLLRKIHTWKREQRRREYLIVRWRWTKSGAEQFDQGYERKPMVLVDHEREASSGNLRNSTRSARAGRAYRCCFPTLLG